MVSYFFRPGNSRRRKNIIPMRNTGIFISPCISPKVGEYRFPQPHIIYFDEKGRCYGVGTIGEDGLQKAIPGHGWPAACTSAFKNVQKFMHRL